MENQRLIGHRRDSKLPDPTIKAGPAFRRTLLARAGSATEGENPTISKGHHRLVVMGASQVGKTAIIQQFLYDTFPADYNATVEELHRAEYDVGSGKLTLDILDTSGSYEFPAMRRLAISSGDAFVLVYAIDNEETFEEMRRLRQLLQELRPAGIPIVIVGNKKDLEERRTIKRELAETMACIDWEIGYVECSAKTGDNVLAIFKELLQQVNRKYRLSPATKRRRRSLPITPVMPCVGGRKRNSCAVS